MNAERKVAILRKIPLALVISRAIIGPVTVALAALHASGWIFGLVITYGLLSDIYDGKIARRLGIATSSIRRLDSIADTIFYLGVGVAAWMLFPALIERDVFLLSILVALEIGRYVLDAVKFGREASYHMWSAKLWGVVLFATFFVVLAIQFEIALMIKIAVVVGILSDLEGVAISLILPECRHDVPTFLHALRIRRRTRRS